MDNSELRHFGVKGMKWGVRRYENEDGTLTEAGKKRYNVGSTEGKSKRRIELEKKYKEQGFSDQQAAIAAERRAKTERILKIAGAAALTAAAAYVAKNEYDKRVDKILSVDASMKRITNNKDGSLHEAFYAANRKDDANKYLGLFGKQRSLRGEVFQATIKPTRDLKIASDKNAERIFENLRNTNSEFKIHTDYLSKKRGGRTPYEAFNRSLIEHDDPAVKKFFEEMRRQGYDGIRDMNDMKYSGYKAKNPLIIFGKDAAKTVSAQKLGQDVIQQNYNKVVLKEIAKASAKSAIPQAAVVGAGATAVAALSKVEANRAVYKYRSKHPNSKMTRQEIIDRYYAKKG